MIKRYIHITIILLIAWGVYGHCQEDLLLPVLAASLIIPSLLLRLRKPESHKSSFDKIPLFIVIIVSFIAAWIWRNLFMVPAFTPLPQIIAASQSASILIACFIFFRSFSVKNFYALAFLAWLTVSTSINVPFKGSMLLTFCSFCIVATALIILQTTIKPQNKKNLFIFYRDLVLFIFLLSILTMTFFYGLSRSIVVVDEAFMDFMDDYILPRHFTNFLSIDSRLRLIPPGLSAFDKRPVLEVSVPDVNGLYLKTQVFDNYTNGAWDESDQKKLTPLPGQFNDHSLHGRLMMFVSLKDIIPSYSDIVSVKGTSTYQKDRYNIIHTADEQQTRIIDFNIKPQRPPVTLTEAEGRQYTFLPPDIADFLKDFSNQLVGHQPKPGLKARGIRNFFHNEFDYSLSINFTADNKGIVKMIRQRLPAYCSYFASASALLIRAQGIPARVATGFLTVERINKKNNTFLVRVRDAHAWTEALLPETDPRTGQTMLTWQIIDATPPLDDYKPLDGFLLRCMEKTWVNFLRLMAYAENIDKDKLKKNLIFVLAIIFILINIKRLLRGLRNAVSSLRRKRPLANKQKTPLQSIYHRYENFLKERYGLTRGHCETDTDLLQRMRKRDDISIKALEPIESFIHCYQAMRFGGKSDQDLDELLKRIIKEADKR